VPHTRAVFPTLLAAVTWASAAGALDVWVDADGGSDEAAGSEGAPFGTLGRACAEPTDDASLVVHVRPGTYREVVRIERDGTHLLVAEADRGDVVLTGSEPSSSLVWTSADPAGLPAAASGQVWGADLSRPGRFPRRSSPRRRRTGPWCGCPWRASPTGR
jgi:pectin methylesterase-like acyl-CoA thioesterase